MSTAHLYAIELTPSEIEALEFARGRYAWPGQLLDCLSADGTVVMAEHEAWE